MNIQMVFTLIFSAIVLILIIIFGGDLWIDITCFGQEAKFAKNIEDVTSLSEEVYQLAEGSTRLYRVGISANDRICFINPSRPYPRDWPEDGRDWKPDSIVYEKMITESGDQYYGSNMWVYNGCKRDRIGKGLKASHLIPKAHFGGDSGNFCSTGGDMLFFEHKGTGVEVSIRK